MTFVSVKHGAKVAVITGAGSGIGLACAHIWAKHGYNVVLAGRTEHTLLQAEQELKNYPVAVLKVICDVAREDDCQHLIAATMQKFSRIDVLIANAGISMRALIEDVELSVLKRVFDTNFWGTVYCVKAALPHLLQRKGSVIGISSIAGILGLPARSGYSASKFAMHGFLQSLRLETMKQGLHVLIACPGFTQSNIRNTALTRDGSTQSETPLDESKLMSAETVAEKIYSAYVHKRKSLVLTSNGKLTAFLLKFVPGFVEKKALALFQAEANTPLK